MKNRYHVKIYAQALADVFPGSLDHKKIADHFLKLLKKNGDMKKAEQILLLAEQLILKKTGNKKPLS